MMDKIHLEKLIKSGKIGVLPTDTIYGLVGSALSPKAVERIYYLKKRNPSKPLIILISDIKDLRTFNIEPDAVTIKILEKYWPGPTSLILPCDNEKFQYLHCGTKSLAFRVPKNDDLQKLLKQTGPLVAPSANPENQPPATNIEEAQNYFQDKADFYFDKGTLKNNPSKLIKIKNGNEKVLRP